MLEPVDVVELIQRRMKETEAEFSDPYVLFRLFGPIPKRVRRRVSRKLWGKRAGKKPRF